MINKLKELIDPSNNHLYTPLGVKESILEVLEEIEKYSLIKKEDTMLSYSVRILDKIDKLKKQFKK